MPSMRPIIPHPTRLLRPSPVQPRFLTPHHLRQTLRALSTTPNLAQPSKSTPSHPSSQRSAQDSRDQINTEANEYAKSGTDDAAAGQEEAAFDPNTSDPQEAKRKAGEGNEVNPLDASPANPELSQHTEESSGGAGKKPSER